MQEIQANGQKVTNTSKTLSKTDKSGQKETKRNEIPYQEVTNTSKISSKTIKSGQKKTKRNEKGQNSIPRSNKSYAILIMSVKSIKSF